MTNLKEVFNRNGLTYRLIARTDKKAFYELTLYKSVVGYEVSIIRQEPQLNFECMTPNDLFGIDESRAFFPHERVRAEMYYNSIE